MNKQSYVICTSKTPPSFRLDGGDELLRQHANAYLRTLEIRALSWRTVRAYAFDLVAFLRWLSGASHSLEDLSQARLLNFIENQKSLGQSAMSINRRLSTCQQYFRFVFDRELPGGQGVTLPSANYRGQGYDHAIGMHWRRRSGNLSLRVKVPQKIIDPLSHTEVILFVKSMRRYRDLSIVFALILAGLRSVEVINLKLDDLNFARREMRVRGKGNKERIIPLAPGLIDLIRSYLKYERPSFSPSENLFVNLQGTRTGEAMTSKGIISLFDRRREKPGLSRGNPHRFRHTFGADMARAGMHLLVIQKLMGHADPRMTTKYINLDISDVAREYKKVMDTIGEKYADKTRQTT